MNASDGAAAIDLGNKILDRYRSIPREVVFSLDAKDSALWITDFITVENRNQVDSFGVAAPVAMQVISASETIQGTKFSYTALEYTGKTAETEPDEFTVDIASDLLNVDLKALYDSKYAHVPVSGDKIRFTIRSNVTIGGTAFSGGTNLDPNLTSLVQTYISDFSTPSDGDKTGIAPILQRKGMATSRSIAKGATYTIYGGASIGDAMGDIEEYPLSVALTDGVWPAGVELFLDVEAGANIIGEGGASGFIGANPVQPVSIPAGDGGNALEIVNAITIDNLGTIGGGGGGGASVQFIIIPPGINDPTFNICSGGGGQGFDTSLASTGWSDGGRIATMPSGGSGAGRGLAGLVNLTLGGSVSAGDGGALGEDGWAMFNFSQLGNAVGKAGAAISSGASNVTWVSKGDVRGAEV